MRALLAIALIVVAAAAGISVGYLASRKPAIKPRGPAITVSFLDEHLGNAIIVQTPEGETIVIDPGPQSTSGELVDYLRELGKREVTLIITNPTSGRAGGAGHLLETLKVKRIVLSEKPSNSKQWRLALREANSKGIPSEVVSAGNAVELSPSVKMDVLSPPRELLDGVPVGSDDNSLVLRLEFLEHRFLLTSDINAKAEAHLIKSAALLESDIFVVPRYGGRGGTSLELLSKVRPLCCVVVCGEATNKPNPTVLKRIDPKNSGADLYRTDKDGTIYIASDGRTIVVETLGAGRG